MDKPRRRKNPIRGGYRRLELSREELRNGAVDHERLLVDAEHCELWLLRFSCEELQGVVDLFDSAAQGTLGHMNDEAQVQDADPQPRDRASLVTAASGLQGGSCEEEIPFGRRCSRQHEGELGAALDRLRR